MKKILLLLMSGFFILSCSIDKNARQLEIENSNGLSTLVLVTNIGESEECNNGGVRLDFGLDLDESGFLDESEIQTTAFVCNGVDGEDGLTSLTNLIPISDEESSCENGGVIVQTGLDINANGVLESDEVLSSTYVCNGVDGENGTDGYNSLINSTIVEPSDEFPNGGVLISIGLDLDFDGILSEDEITQVTFISNGIDGVDGQDGVDGVDGIGVTITTEETEGGYWIYFWEGDEIINQIFIANGVDGIDGIDGEDGATVDVTTEEVEGGHIITFSQNGVVVSQIFIADGVDGTNGVDGLDGTSTTITTEDTEGGYIIYFWEGDEIINQIFVANGIDGEDGTDGISTTVTTEQTEGGYWIYFWEDDVIVNQIFVSNGVDGIDGINGSDGTDGTNGLNNLINLLPNTPSNGQTTIQVGLDINANGVLELNEVLNSTVINDGEDGEDGLTSYIFVTELESGEICEDGGLQITFGLDLNGDGELDEEEATVEYICCDYCCNETYTICVKCPSEQCHWNWDTLTLDNVADYNYYMGIYDDENEGNYYIYHTRSFDTPEGYSCDDFDCDSSPDYN